MGLFECFLDWTMVGVVFLLLSYAWGVFVFLVCMPLIQAGYPLLWPISYLVIGHILFVLVIWSYLRAVLTRTYVPSSFTHEYSATESLNSDKDSEKQKRYCQKCEQDKPERAHHCSRCQRCILKMDHHCPWINNCVGWRNYKYFMLFTTYTMLLCLAGIIMMAPQMIMLWDWSNLDWRNIMVIAVAFLAGIFALTLMGFVLYVGR